MTRDLLCSHTCVSPPLRATRALFACVVSALSSGIKARAIEAAQSKTKAESGGDEQADRVEASAAAAAVAAPGATGTSHAKAVTGTTQPAEGTTPAPTKEASDKTKGAGEKTSHLTAVAVCVAGAVMSSMLQFSFVYGKRRVMASLHTRKHHPDILRRSGRRISVSFVLDFFFCKFSRLAHEDQPPLASP